MAILAALFSAVATAQLTTGPTSPYYLSNWNSQTIYVVQGNAVIDTFPWAGNGNYSDGMIAVSSFVEARAFGDTHPPGSGAEYTLAGVPTGFYNPYVLPAGITSELAYDGASDGKHNYYVQYYGIDASGANVENVYQTGLSWQNPTLLFSVQSVGGARAEYLGIAYDSRNNSLWVSGWGATAVNDYSLSGALLSSFTGPGSLSALAYDSADNTLWGSYDETNSLYQYSLAGVLLQSGTPAGLPAGNYLGGDMSTGSGSGSGVPEPATTVLVVAGLAALVARRRRLV
jgi:hypothetical protein